MFDILGLLIAGGTVVLVPPAAGLDPAAWPALIRREAVTIWHSVPALTELLADRLAVTGEQLPALRLALVSGDWIPLHLPGRMRAGASGVRFVSMGGATEASVDSFSWPVDETDPDWASVPYGRPLSNQHAYILDERGHPVPAGAFRACSTSAAPASASVTCGGRP